MVDAIFMLVLFSLPTLVYANIQTRQGASWGQALSRFGIRPSRRAHYAWAVGVLVVLGAVLALAASLSPPEALQHPRVLRGRDPGAGLGPGTAAAVVLRALAEEMLYRGFLLTLLFERFPFAVSNAIQAVVYAAFQLVLLLISPGLWPVVLAYLVAGWLLGWLRHRSGSIIPGTAVHMVLSLTAVAAYGP